MRSAFHSAAFGARIDVGGDPEECLESRPYPGLRGACEKPHLIPDSHGNHVVPNGLSKPDASVETFGDDVDEAALRTKIEFHLRISLEEARDYAGH